MIQKRHFTRKGRIDSLNFSRKYTEIAVSVKTERSYILDSCLQIWLNNLFEINISQRLYFFIENDSSMCLGKIS